MRKDVGEEIQDWRAERCGEEQDQKIKIVETRGADKPAVSSDTLEGPVCSLPNLSSLLKLC